MSHKRYRAAIRKNDPKPLLLIKLDETKRETSAVRAARMARIIAISNDPTRRDWVRFANAA